MTIWIRQYERQQEPGEVDGPKGTKSALHSQFCIDLQVLTSWFWALADISCFLHSLLSLHSLCYFSIAHDVNCFQLLDFHCSSPDFRASMCHCAGQHNYNIEPAHSVHSPAITSALCPPFAFCCKPLLYACTSGICNTKIEEEHKSWLGNSYNLCFFM